MKIPLFAFARRLGRSFAARLYAYLGVALLALAALLGATIDRGQARLLKENLHSHGETLADLLARSARLGVFSENPRSLAESSSHLLERPGVNEVAVFDARGQVLYRGGPLGAQPRVCRNTSPWGVEQALRAAPRPVALEGPDCVTFWAPVLSPAAERSTEALYFDSQTSAPEARLMGVAAVTLSKGHLRDARSSILRRSVAASLAFLALGALVTALAVREATRPLRLLLRRVRDLGLPAPPDEGDLGLLDDTLGVLAGRLDGALGRIAELTGSLEATVEARTAELLQANEELQHIREDLERRVEERTVRLQKTHQQLLHAEKLGAVGRLAASLAHEFNNPLFGIRSALQTVRQAAGLPATDVELLDLAVAECDRAARLIRSLQSFNRPSSGVWEPVRLPGALDAILLLCRKELGAKNARVETSYPEGLPPAWGVEDQLKQVFLNLLTNALDALPPGGGVIRVAAEARGDRVAVRIQDSGAGIAPEHLPRLFEPFFTTKPGTKGTGLGLSVSHGIVEAHGGTIEVESRPGQGSSFTVLLPTEGAKA